MKTATKHYPLSYLSNQEIFNRGDRKAVVALDANGLPCMMSFSFMDRERRFFIATGDSLNEGNPFVRKRWRQLVQNVAGVPNVNPLNVTLIIPQPKACETYYGTCEAIDQHNRDRQDTLQLE